MNAKIIDRFATPPKSFSLASALGIAVLSTSFFLTVGVNKTRAEIINSVTEDISQANVREHRGAKGGAACNKLENVTTFMGNTAHPVRAGKQAFMHRVDRCGERSELTMKRTEIGKTYWYGWSVFIPSDWSDQDPEFDILAQWATYPSPRNGKFVCGANGSHMARNGSNVAFKFQRQGERTDVECNLYALATVSEMQGKWVDFVMQAKWTGNKDGFLKLWMKIGNGAYTQKVGYTGRTFWNDEGTGPYFKMGLYKGDPNFKGPAPRTVYTDEHRLGNDKSTFEEVSPD